MSKSKKKFVYYVDKSGIYKLTVDKVNKNFNNVTSTQQVILTPGYESLGKFKHVASSLVQNHFTHARDKYLELLQEDCKRVEAQLNKMQDIIEFSDSHIKPI